MIIDKKIVLFSLKLPFSKKISVKDLSTIYYKHTKIDLCENFLVFCDMSTYSNSSKIVLILKKNCQLQKASISNFCPEYT